MNTIVMLIGGLLYALFKAFTAWERLSMKFPKLGHFLIPIFLGVILTPTVIALYALLLMFGAIMGACKILGKDGACG